MIIFPAIDLKGGACVRLIQGDYATAHQVAEDAVETAKAFYDAGARWIHMVDLDGAKAKKPVNTQPVLDVLQNSGLKVELGGGIRSMETVDFYLEAGISRVILGSAALQNPDFVRCAVEKYGEKIAVGIDARDGKVAAEGWTASSSVDYLELAKAMEQVGVKYIIFTDISRDGTLSGPNLNMLETLNRAVSCDITASGGVSGLHDILDLRALGLYGAICGKALYTGDLELRAAIEAAEGGSEV